MPGVAWGKGLTWRHLLAERGCDTPGPVLEALCKEPGHQKCHYGLLAACPDLDHPELWIILHAGKQGVLIKDLVLLLSLNSIMLDI